MSGDLQQDSKVMMQLDVAGNDRSILERIAMGEQTAVKECVESYGPLVWSIAKKYSPTHSDAEDAVQEVFIELWKKAASFDPKKARESTFVAMICRRRTIDRLRRHNAKTADRGVPIGDMEIADAAASVDTLEIDDEAAKAMGCIKKLSVEHRRVITMSLHQGISHQGIADHLSMPLGTVKTYARRALLQLRECMDRKAMLHPLGEV